MMYCCISVFSAQREFERCVNQINEKNCRRGTVIYFKNQFINNTLTENDLTLCDKQKGLNLFCNNDDLKDEDVWDFSFLTNIFKELFYKYSFYVSPLLLVFLFFLYIMKKVKCCAQEIPAEPEPFYYELDRFV